MIPRKVNTLFPAVAAETGVSEEEVSDIVGFYWKAVKKELDEPTHITLLLEHMGTFEIRRKQVEYQIKKQKGIIKYVNPNTYAKHIFFDSAKQKLVRLKKMLEMCKEQEEKKKQIREIQKNGKTV